MGQEHNFSRELHRASGRNRIGGKMVNRVGVASKQVKDRLNL